MSPDVDSHFLSPDDAPSRIGAVNFHALEALAALHGIDMPELSLKRGVDAVYQALTRKILHATSEHPYGLASDTTLRPDWLVWWKVRGAPFFQDWAKRSSERWTHFGPNIAPYLQWHKRLIDLHKEAEALGILAPMKVSSDEGEQTMSAHAGLDLVGADSHARYRNTAIHAVKSTAHQSPSPVYGYLRFGRHQKIYLFPDVPDARAWFDQRAQLEAGYDYAAVFAAADLHTPVVEDFAPPVVSGDGTEVGHWFLPLALGVPAAGLGGYYYRKWQEEHPGKLIPGISGEAGPSVGGPWVDIVGQDTGVGGPWVDIIGASVDPRRQSWRQTKALIQSAISEVLEAYAMAPAVAYVWSLDPPGPAPSARVELTGTSTILPFSSHAEALAYIRERLQTPHVALALFDKTSPHWPNPVNWAKSDDPAHAPLIAEQIAKHASTRAAGEIGEVVGTEPWQTIVGAAIGVLRRQAKVAAEEMPGHVIGVRRDARNSWTLKSFRSLDDADDWFGRAIAEPADFTYAAYFEKDAHGIPYLENEAIGGARGAAAPGRPISREIATVTVSP